MPLSAQREAVSNKARLAGHTILTLAIGLARCAILARRVLSKRRKAVDDRFSLRPKGDQHRSQYCVVAFVGDWATNGRLRLVLAPMLVSDLGLLLVTPH